MRRRGGGGLAYPDTGGTFTNPTGGTASSFGSYVTAPGGAAGNGSQTPTAQQTRQAIRPCSISVPYITGSTTQNMTCYIVSRGGMGWLPGVELPDPDLSILPRLMAPQTGSLNMQTVSNGVLRRMWYSNSTNALSTLNPNNEQTPRTDRRGGVAYDTRNNYLQVTGNVLYLCTEPAIGYGAGGGGWHAATGGNAGVVKLASVTLASTASISVTVGAGGAGGYTHYHHSGTTYIAAYGGGGARGCVAVFW